MEPGRTSAETQQKAPNPHLIRRLFERQSADADQTSRRSFATVLAYHSHENPRTWGVTVRG
jgi:hypothetical protein